VPVIIAQQVAIEKNKLATAVVFKPQKNISFNCISNLSNRFNFNINKVTVLSIIGSKSNKKEAKMLEM